MQTKQTDAADKGVLTVYLIAGQSNAAGFSKNENLTCSEEKKAEYTEGYSKVWYHGRSEENVISGYETPVALGMGRGTAYFGAEVGMAEVISEENQGGQAVILRYAIGGSYLIDNQTHSVSVAYGNWCPPSMRTSSAKEGLTGILYDGFISLVQNAVSHYQTEGYTVNLKGTFWMQGEAENGAISTEGYAQHLKAFINDMREDLAETFDNDVANAPFVIGKIASTFAGGGAGVEQIRAAQDLVASPTGEYSVNKAYTVETKDYYIVDPNTNQIADGCYDRYHFSADDMISIGHEVAECILKYSVPALEVYIEGDGSANILYQVLTGEPVTVTFTPDQYRVFKKLTKNGVDVTANMNGNSYTVTETDESVRLIAEFSQAEKYALTVKCDREKASIAKNIYYPKYYAGQEVIFTVKPKEGYEVEKVLFAGNEVSANANGKYAITVVDGENVFEVVFKGDETMPKDEGGKKEKKGGCGSFIGGLSAGTVVLVGCFVLTRKKNDHA